MKPSRLMILAFVAAVLAVTILLLIIPSDAIISGVPYAGIYNADFTQTDVAMTVYSILGYWHQYDSSLPQPSLSEMYSKFPPESAIHPSDIISYFRSMGYDAPLVRTASLRKLAKYLGSTERTPLLFSQLPNPDFEAEYTPYRVLIGISFSEANIMVHDVFFGPAYKMSFREWHKNYPRVWPENQKYTFIVARPKNYKTLIASHPPLRSTHPDRDLYSRFKPLIHSWLKTAEDVNQSPEQQLQSYVGLSRDHLFVELSPAMRVMILNNAAALLNTLSKYYDAKSLAEDAIELNHDLDKPFNIWSGFPKNQLPNPWKHLGDAYIGLGDDEKAHYAYLKALAIDPEYKAAKDALGKM